MTRRIRLSTDHAASSYGIPVVVGPAGAMDYADGLRALRAERGWSVADLAERCGVSARTVEGWEQGRPPSGPALIALMRSMR